VTQELLRLEQIRAGYGDREPVLLDVNLTVHEGEALGIVGMNGAGKSSLMKVISGSLRPRSGNVVFAGRNVSSLKTADRARLGIVLLPEGHRVIRPLTVHENLEIAVMALSPARVRDRLREILPVVHELFPILRERRDLPAGVLSGGEQQMLSIARAMVQRPRLLLLDEPSLGLAPVVIDRIYSSLGMLRERGMSLLIVEQNSDRVAGACSRLLVLRDGRVVDQGGVHEISGSRLHTAYFGATA
jgi:branched-chain amino acid transport system ATP-binding protein